MVAGYFFSTAAEVAEAPRRKKRI